MNGKSLLQIDKAYKDIQAILENALIRYITLFLSEHE